ncbi:MAG: SEC-C domain-containing protein [Clostridia bacterium]|nr:SEC-C domain-containing protein [Clostridia bacterium]
MTQEELLRRSTVTELRSVCERMGAEPPRALRGKEGLIRLLQETLRAHPERLWMALSPDGMDLLWDCMTRGAAGSERWPLNPAEAEAMADDLELLRWMGLSTCRGHAWSLLPELWPLLPATDAQWQKVDQLGACLDEGMVLLSYWGMATAEMLLREIRRSYPDAVLPGPEELNRIYTAGSGTENTWRSPDGRLWLLHPDCTPEDLWNLWEREPILKLLPWAEINLPALEKVPLDVPLPQEAWDALCGLLERRGMREEDIAPNLVDCLWKLQTESLGDAVDTLREGFPQPLEAADAWVITYCVECLPLWRFRGRSLHTLRKERAAFIREHKPDPNAPCPCGSGRPYARCHGRLN